MYTFRGLRVADAEKLREAQDVLLEHDAASFLNFSPVDGNSLQHWRNEILELTSASESDTLVALSPERSLVGVAGVFDEPDGPMTLSKLWVHPMHRGEQPGGVRSDVFHTGVRVAHQLLYRAEAVARRRGAEEFHLSVAHTQHVAQSFYQRHGFRAYEKGEYTTRMSKPLR